MVVDDTPTPYRIALLRVVQRLAPFRLSVVWLSAQAKDKDWRLDSEGLDCHAVSDHQLYLKGRDIRLQFNWGLGRRLTRLAPDVVVVGGYALPAYWRCLAFARRRGLPLVLWAGTTPASEFSSDGPVRWAKRLFVALCRGFVAYGSGAATLLRQLGAPEASIQVVTNTTDMAGLRDQTRRLWDQAPGRGALRLLATWRLV